MSKTKENKTMYMDSINSLMVLGTCLLGISFGWFCHEVLLIVMRPTRNDSQAWQHDERRRETLRRGSELFRWFEPLIMDLARVRLLMTLGNVGSVERSLLQGGAPLPWSAREYLAVAAFRSMLASLAWLILSYQSLGLSNAILTAVLILSSGILMAPRKLATLAKVRMRRFKQRLPYAIDLMALMMEAGGDFRQCLTTVVHENRGHPVGDEFGWLLKSFAAGQPLRESLDLLQSRLRDEDVHEIVFSIKNAEELGVPLSKTFLTLAEQMRLKRAQNAEKMIGERKTMLAFPSLIIMIACLIIAVAPTILNAVFHG